MIARLGLLVAMLGAVAARAEDVHLFLDPAAIVALEHVSRTVNPPGQRQVVIRADRPWEGLMISFYTTVLDEGGKLRLWYICRDRENRPNVAYAESSDGVHWQKPDLGIVAYGGNRHNNLVGIPWVEGTVFVDPNAAPAERYGYITQEFPHGLFRYVSPDGLHWRRIATPLLLGNSDTQNVVCWDTARHTYLFLLRGWNPGSAATRTRKVVALDAASLAQPIVIAPGSQRDFWGNSDLPWLVDQVPTVLACDEADPPHSDIYNLSATPYDRAPGWYVGFPSFFRHHPDSTYRGRLEVQFVASPDGYHWERYDRRAYAEPSGPGGNAANMVFIGPGLVRRGDELWQYGTGFRSEHGDVAARQRHTDGVIYRYVQRLDGFVSLDAGVERGRFSTTPVRITGNRLTINADTGALGAVRVGLYDADGTAVPGHALEDCDPINGNATAIATMWRGQQDLSALRGREVVLRVELQRAKLYSYSFWP